METEAAAKEDVLMGRRKKEEKLLEEKDEALHRKIRHRAKEMFLELGYVRTTLPKLAESLGIPQRQISLWYRTKEELLDDLAAQLMERTRDYICHTFLPDEAFPESWTREEMALYRYVMLLGMEMEVLDTNTMLWSFWKTAYCIPHLLERVVARHYRYVTRLFSVRMSSQFSYEKMLLVCSGLGGHVMAHGFRKPYHWDRIRRTFLTHSLRIFGISSGTIQKMLDRLEEQRPLLEEISGKILGSL